MMMTKVLLTVETNAKTGEYKTYDIGTFSDVRKKNRAMISAAIQFLGYRQAFTQKQVRR